jgi:histidinol-phosphate aminotransferase
MPWIRRAAPAFYNVSGIAAAAAVASLQDVDHLMENVALLNRERDQLQQDLNAIPGVEAFDSSANFILFRFPPECEEAINKAFSARNIFIRRYTGSLAEFIRVSIGAPDENAIFLEAMREAVIPATV